MVREMERWRRKGRGEGRQKENMHLELIYTFRSICPVTYFLQVVPLPPLSISTLYQNSATRWEPSNTGA